MDANSGVKETLDGSDGMFVLGEHEKYISLKSLQLAAKQYPKMRVETVPNANHFLHQDNPKGTNELLWNFIGPASNYPVERFNWIFLHIFIQTVPNKLLNLMCIKIKSHHWSSVTDFFALFLINFFFSSVNYEFQTFFATYSQNYQIFDHFAAGYFIVYVSHLKSIWFFWNAVGFIFFNRE